MKIFFLMAIAFALLAFISNMNYKRKLNNFSGKTDGIVEEVISGWSKGIGGKRTDRFLVYSYIVDKHRYIVKPLVLNKNSELNRIYYDSDNSTCITYIGGHSGSNQTKYRGGERFEVLYNIKNPKEHIILDDKDRKFFAKGFYFVGALFFVVALVITMFAIVNS